LYSLKVRRFMEHGRKRECVRERERSDTKFLHPPGFTGQLFCLAGHHNIVGMLSYCTETLPQEQLPAPKYLVLQLWGGKEALGMLPLKAALLLAVPAKWLQLAHFRDYLVSEPFGVCGQRNVNNVPVGASCGIVMW
jgi:hypothetical protein